jgi:hypothetical protein
MIYPTIDGYKYMYSDGNRHIFAKFSWWRANLIEVTTEQIKSGEIHKIIQAKNKKK